MLDLLVTIHAQLRWAVLAVLLLGGAYALLQAPRGVSFTRAPFSVAVAVVDVQVLLGIVIYIWAAGWRDELFIALIHPLAMIVGAVVAHVGVARGAREGATRAYQITGAAFLAALGIIILGVPWA